MLSARRNSRRNTAVGTAEPLEQRTVLAGNMAAFFADGALVLEGDGKSNSVEIAPNTDGGISIFGVDGTRVNGSFDPVDINDDTFLPEDILVRSGRGHDSILIESIDVGGSVVMVSGGGADKLDLFDVAIVGDVFMSGGRGNDTLVIEDSAVGGALDVAFGREHDEALIEGSLIAGDVNLLGGLNRDEFTLNSSTFESNVRIAAGAGSDIAVISNSTVEGVTTALMGRGDDGLGFVDNVFRDFVYGNGGRSGDSLLLDSPFLGGFEFDSFEFDA